MMELKKFGDESRFAIAMNWAGDADKRDRTPKHGGASLGELQISVGGETLTLVRQAGRYRNALRWYLLPVFEWLANNWVALLHEQNFAWREDGAASAAESSFYAFRRLATATSDEDCLAYEAVQSWWSRHALRAADSSALYPDLFLRRFGDDIEVSWTARQPLYAPQGFHFDMRPGICLLPVADVARPLWEALQWAVQTMPVSNKVDEADQLRLKALIDKLSRAQNKELEARYLSDRLQRVIEENRSRLDLPDESVRIAQVPALEHFDSPVFMFGGINPDIQTEDVESLLTFLAESKGEDSVELDNLVNDQVGLPIAEPHIEGYEMAEELLAEVGLPDNQDFVDIRKTLGYFKIRVLEQSLRTNSVRGVAVAGVKYAPSILINLTHGFNSSEDGRRFTLAHELFHILFDRSRAKRVAHSSAPWAPAAIEKRANAFAAMFLMPRELTNRITGEPTSDEVRVAAKKMRVSRSTLIEHLYNIGRIDQIQRNGLRATYD